MTRISISTRLALLWALLCALLMGMLGWLTWRGGRLYLLESRRETLGHEARLVKAKLQSAVADTAGDCLFLSRMPNIRSFMQPTTEVRAPVQQLVEEDFAALLQGKPNYFQVRLIGVADGGKELVRLDHSNDGLTITPPEKLQRKGDRDYYQATLGLAAGTVALSEIDLNRDFGKITEPHIPTLRVSTPIHHADGRLFGMIVINYDLRALIAELQSLPDAGVRLEMANSHGDYFIHPQPAALFASDLGGPAPASTDRSEGLSWEEPIRLAVGPAGASREVSMRLHFPEQALLAGWRGVRTQVLWITLAATLLGSAVIAWLVKRAVHRLETARHMAEAAAQAREDFLARMSHEIRTPMNSVTGMLGVLERNKPSPHQEPVLRSLKAAAAALMRLLNDALDWSKMRAGGLDFEDKEFSLRQTLEEVILTHRPQALLKQIELRMDYPAEYPEWVHGDPLRLSQVIHNLVSNALKFTSSGLVQLTVEHSRAEPDHWELSVTDTGIGISEADLKHIFDPYHQVGPAGLAHLGSGLGLAIAQQIITRQGGQLEVRSELGKGSTFVVALRLPAARPRPDNSTRSETNLPSLAGLRLLYVEDLESNREVMAAHLEGSGAQLTLAEDGASGILALTQGVFDLALLDLQLPDVTGLELAAQIRAQSPTLPMLAVTAQALSGTLADCLAAGMSGIVTKPIDRAELYGAIARACSPAPALDLSFLTPLCGADLARQRKFLALLATEFRAHQEALTAALQVRNVTQLRSLRHRMTTALAQLQQKGLATILDTLIANPNDAVAAQAAYRSLQKITQALDRALADRPQP